MSDTPITDAFEQSCATATALRYKKEIGEKANLIEIEFVLALENSRRFERENAVLRRELDKAYEKCAAIAGNAYRNAKETEQAHYRLSDSEFEMMAFGISPDVVNHSRYIEERILALKYTDTNRGTISW